MKFGEGLSGTIRFRLTSGDVSYVLQALANSNVIISDVEMESELSALVSISSGDYRKALKILKRNGARCELLRRRGISWMLYRLRKRAVLIGGCLVLTVLTIWIPTRIFFLEVKGNESLPANYIITQATEEGLIFGCKRAEVRSEKLKNQLLAKIPQLEWVGVTTSGCVATISVSESQTPNTSEEKYILGNIVAVCDGVVNSVTVTKGNPICRPGQAVQKGQILISGYEDCGLVLKHSGAEGEVYADTYRILEGVSLVNGGKRTDSKFVFHAITIRIGKKLIKFSKDSGISHTSCVKMYSERYATLPGGFRLPVSLIIETYYDYEFNSYSSEDDESDWISGAVEIYLQSQMLGGKVLSGDLKLDAEESVCRFRGAYRCREQIGMTRIEEILPYGKDS